MAEEVRKVVLELLARNRAAGDLAAFNKSIDGTVNSVQKAYSGFRTFSSILKMGTFTYAANSFANMATNMMKAQRSGESMFNAFLAGLPIVNRLAESAEKLADEISGLAAAAEIADKAITLEEKYSKIQQQLIRNIDLLQASKEEAAALKAQYQYEDRLKEINALNSEIGAMREYNKTIDDQIAALEKLKGARNKMAIGGFGAMGYAPQGMSDEEINRRVRDLQGQKMAIPTLEPLVRQAEIERGLAGQFKENMDVRVEIHREGMRRIIDQESDAARLMRYHQEYAKHNWTTMWDSLIDGSMSAKEAINAFFRNFIIQAIQARVQMQMLNLWNAGAGGVLGGFFAAGGGGGFTTGGSSAGYYAAGPYPVHHKGGTVGEPAPTRWVNSRVFENAPRYHDLLPGEVAVIAQKGERISRPGGGNSPTVIFNNYGPPIQQKGEAKYDGEKVIISIESALNDRIQRRSGPLFSTIRGVK